MSIFFSNSLTKSEYSNLLIVEAFSYGPFSIKTLSPIKNSYLLTFPDDKAEISVVCLSKSC